MIGSRFEKLLAELRAELVPHYAPDARTLRALDDLEQVLRTGEQLATEARLQLAGAEYASQLAEALERWDGLAGTAGEQYVVQEVRRLGT